MEDFNIEELKANTMYLIGLKMSQGMTEDEAWDSLKEDIQKRLESEKEKEDA